MLPSGSAGQNRAGGRHGGERTNAVDRLIDVARDAQIRCRGSRDSRRVTAMSRASCRCTFTFHDCTDAFRNRGSIVDRREPGGPRRVDRARRAESSPPPSTASPNGGLPAVSLTAVVPGSSTARAYAARSTVRPSPTRSPRHADARLEVPVVLLVDLVDVDADAHKRRASRASKTTNRLSRSVGVTCHS